MIDLEERDGLLEAQVCDARMLNRGLNARYKKTADFVDLL
jgi:hypothetical protein